MSKVVYISHSWITFEKERGLNTRKPTTKIAIFSDVRHRKLNMCGSTLSYIVYLNSVTSIVYLHNCYFINKTYGLNTKQYLIYCVLSFILCVFARACVCVCECVHTYSKSWWSRTNGVTLVWPCGLTLSPLVWTSQPDKNWSLCRAIPIVDQIVHLMYSPRGPIHDRQ
jgi:hypothetical protein